MDYDGKNMSGTVNPGPNALPIKLARLDIVAIVAGFLPAHRASRIEPMTALHYE